VSIKSFPDYKHLLQENYCTWNTNFFYHYLVSKILCHVFIATFVTFGFWMQHFQTGGLGEMARYPGHHDRQISPPFDIFLLGYVQDKVFWTPVPDITKLKAIITCFCYNN